MWGISWKLWLPAIAGDLAHDVHRIKQLRYTELLREGAAKRLPGADMAEALLASGHHVAFVTAASEASALAVLEWLQFAPDLLWGYELSSDGRARALEDFASVAHEAAAFTYVDDREEGRNVALAAGYDFLHAAWTL